MPDILSGTHVVTLETRDLGSCKTCVMLAGGTPVEYALVAIGKVDADTGINSARIVCHGYSPATKSFSVFLLDA